MAIPRHQTLRAAVDWSFELLTAEEAALLRRLSVFAGGLGLEAAEAVGVGDPVDEYDVLDLIARLADKSLVTVDSSGPEARYRLSEILRAYSYERLVQAGEAARRATSPSRLVPGADRACGQGAPARAGGGELARSP